MSLNDALRDKDFVVTAQPNLAAAPDADSLLTQARLLQPAVDAVQLTDKSSQSLQMSSLAAAAILLREGIEPVMHLACRDRNRIAMDKDLVGAAALGVSSIIVKRGRKIVDVDTLDTRNVYDITPIKFASYIRSLREVENSVLPDHFLVGANANILRPDRGWTADKLIRKIDAGVNFFQSPICFDMDVIRSYMAAVVDRKLTHRAKFIMAVSPMPTADIACWMRDNVSSSHMPDAIVRRMQQAADPEQEGVEICAELLRELAEIPGVSGVNLLTLGPLETIPAAIDAAGIRQAKS